VSDVDAMLSTLENDESADIKALSVLKRGMDRTPAVKRTIVYSGLISLSVAVGRLAVPVLVQQVIDRGLLGDDGYRPGLILALSLATLAIVLLVAVLTPVAEVAMVRGAQESLYQLRRQAFAHIHHLSLSQHSQHPRGALLARVSSDIETMSRFVEWGAITWAMNLSIIVGAFAVMLVYSWQLSLIALASMATVVPMLRWLQVRQLRAYDRVRTAVGRLLTVFNEILTGSDSIRSYGYQPTARSRIRTAVGQRYKAEMGTAKYTAALFTVADVVAAASLAVVALAAVEWGEGWGLGAGSVVSFFFLINLVQTPIGEITEVMEDTQSAVAGWNKVLTMLDEEPDLVEAEETADLPQGPLSIQASGLHAAYGETPVLFGIDVAIPAGTRVAIVGETGSGKTTFARLLCRLLDPTAGTIRLGGVDLSTVSTASRQGSVRLVPQDGFLFSTTVAKNISYGHPGTTNAEIEAAIDELDLHAWVARLPNGLDSDVGPRGEFLSVGERQLVALARAQVADPGVLILDEATSSVDPETEQALARALRRVAAGRTMVSVAHRLSTAEQADLVLVFDDGRLIEQGSHDELVALGGSYAELHRSWERTTGAT